MLPSAKFILGFIVIIIITYFALYNMQDVTVRYYFGSRAVTVPLSFVIYGAFVVGFVISWAIRAVKQIRLARQVKRYQKVEQCMVDEIRGLRDQLEQTSRKALEAALAPGGEEDAAGSSEADAQL
jgi:uncharacterized integral membrane protein